MTQRVHLWFFLKVIIKGLKNKIIKRLKNKISKKSLGDFILPSYPPSQHIVKLLPLLRKLGSVCTTPNSIFSHLISGQQSQQVQFLAIKSIFSKSGICLPKDSHQTLLLASFTFPLDDSVMQLGYWWAAVTSRLPFAFWCTFDFDALSIFSL